MEHVFVVLAYKESKELENCIKSVLNQSIKTNVVIATSTPNNYIKTIAKKWKYDYNYNCKRNTAKYIIKGERKRERKDNSFDIR